MTRDELFEEVQNNTYSLISEQRIMAAVDAYTEALIAANAVLPVRAAYSQTQNDTAE